MLLIITFIINFRFNYAPKEYTPPSETIQKVIIIKKIYIRVPSAVDSTHKDSTTTITLPKEVQLPNYKKFYRSRNLHKSGFIS